MLRQRRRQQVRRLQQPGPATDPGPSVKTAPCRRSAGVRARLGALLAEVAPLVCPVLLLVRDAAAHDPEMRSLQADWTTIACAG